MPVAAEIQPNDYSLVGKNTALAIQQGLAEATWYTSPVPRDKMRELLQREDGPPCGTPSYGSLCSSSPAPPGVALWGTWWAILPFLAYGAIYASTSDSRWHECGHGTAFKTDWMNNALYEIASFMVHARIQCLGAGATPGITATRSSSAAIRRSPCRGRRI